MANEAMRAHGPSVGAEETRRSALQRDSVDFIAAFATGAALGAGVVLLVRSRRPRGVARLSKDLRPYRKALQRRAKEARSGFSTGTRAAAEAAELLGVAGRTLLRDFREELADSVISARTELSAAVSEQLEHARHALRRGARQVGRA
jgi:hypothetical protein